MSEETKKEQASDLELENKNSEITIEKEETTEEEKNSKAEIEPQAEKAEPEELKTDEETATDEVVSESAEDSIPIEEPSIEDSDKTVDPNNQEIKAEVEVDSTSEKEAKVETSEVEESSSKESVEEENPKAKEILATKTEETANVTPEEDTKVETSENEEPSSTETVEEKASEVEETQPEIKPDATSEDTDKVEKPQVAAVEDNDTEKDSESKNDQATEEEAPEPIDYTTYSREALVAVVEEISQNENFKGSENILNQVSPLFFKIEKGVKESALNKFLLDGGVADDFEFNHDEFYNRFDASVKLARDKRARFYKEREASKERNYEKKLELLDRLRLLVDGDGATTSLSPIKEIQQEWRAVGAVPNQHNRTLWANYNALLDRFYDHRHILFELKELDRKKNQGLKEELCVKAEALDKVKDLKTAIVQLNELHEEYKHVGPVPREIQEALWQRFKSASDVVYKKRKSYLDDLKGELQENLVKKKALVVEIKEFTSFDSDRINDWNGKTKEVIAVQKKWEALGGLPREHAKEINKDFWAAFKTFFHHKNEFFKKLEGRRKENLEAKQQLVDEARTLKDSDDWIKTADKLKGLQRKWKDVGPVPEKFRNSIYADFKAACDEFFNNRRDSQNKEEEGYSENLVKKEALCKMIFDKAETKDGEATELDEFVEQWKTIGFVPKNAIKKIDQKFQKSLEVFVSSLELTDDDKEGLILKAQLVGLSKGPNGDRNIQKKEGALRRQVKELEDNVSLWNNNLAFFANSKTADKLKAEFNDKIEKSEEELKKLKKQLWMIRSI